MDSSDVFFRVRLDAAMERGEDRAAIMEQWNRAPEEWERFRPIRLQPQGFTQLRIASPSGPIEVVAHPMCPPNHFLLVSASGAQQQVIRGIISADVIGQAVAVSGRRRVRAVVTPHDWAELNRQMAATRRYDATPFPRSLFGIDEQIWSPIAGARWPTAEEVEQYQRLAGATLTVTNVDVEGRTVTISADAPPAIPATSRRHRATPSRVPAGLQRKPWGR